jgi:hypothetical protein
MLRRVRDALFPFSHSIALLGVAARSYRRPDVLLFFLFATIFSRNSPIPDIAVLLRRASAGYSRAERDVVRSRYSCGTCYLPAGILSVSLNLLLGCAVGGSLNQNISFQRLPMMGRLIFYDANFFASLSRRW